MINFPENTAGWAEMVTRLEEKLAGITTRLSEIDARRKFLALDVALGDKAAGNESLELLKEKTRLTADHVVTVEGLIAARACLDNSRHEDENRMDSERRAKLDAARGELLASAERVDMALCTLAAALVGYFTDLHAVQLVGGEIPLTRLRGWLACAIWHSLAAENLHTMTGVRYKVLHGNFSGEDRPALARWQPLATSVRRDWETPE